MWQIAIPARTAEWTHYTVRAPGKYEKRWVGTFWNGPIEIYDIAAPNEPDLLAEIQRFPRLDSERPKEYV